MHYYKTAILRSASPILTYSSKEKLNRGCIVDVPLHGRARRAAILEETEKPKEFETENIINISDEFFNTIQFESAEFISEYYFSSMGEALALFQPCKKDTETVPHHIDEISLPTLSKLQQKAFDNMNKNPLSLLFGVTGSGKTELYIHKMYQTVKNGKSAIMLIPEIALTPQMLKRLKSYFGDRVDVWHSKLSKKRKEDILRRIIKGKIKIIAGARSSLFLPMRDLGLIIVDEEHDDSYKANNRPRYHARDMAVWMGKKFGLDVWLASATPSLTSYLQYPVARLKEPYISSEKSYRFIGGDTITPEIISALENNYRRGEQSLLFVPTRANFKYLYCRECGQTHLCPFCSVGMSLHRYAKHVRCHYCGYTEMIPQQCTKCGYSPLSSDRIGTMEAADIIKEAIDGIRVEILDKDHITTASKLEKALKRIESGESDVIVGTQMLSKGHDYPNITLSIITGLDYILGISDYKAAQKAVGLLHQIAGRSGRSKPATVLIQSSKEEYFGRYIDDYEQFLKDEEGFAKDLYPPFRKLARVLISDKNDERASKLCHNTAVRLQQFQDIELIGYGKAPIEKIAGKYRYTILLRAKKRIPLLKALYSIRSPKVEIDIDPVDFS